MVKRFGMGWPLVIAAALALAPQGSPAATSTPGRSDHREPTRSVSTPTWGTSTTPQRASGSFGTPTDSTRSHLALRERPGACPPARPPASRTRKTSAQQHHPRAGGRDHHEHAERRAGDILNVNQTYSFVASNVVRIAESITNVSGVAQLVNFARNVDYDIAPTAFVEFTKSNFWNNPITAATYDGFENPSPLVPYAFPAAPGSVNGPSDLGAGFQINLGTLAAGATTSFYVYYGLNSSASFPRVSTPRSRALAPSLWGMSTGTSSETGDWSTATNSIVLAVGAISAITPEPSSMAIFGLSGLALAGFGLRRRRTV